MTYKVSSKLLELIATIDNKILRNSLTLVAYIVGGPIFLYFRDGKIINVAFIVCCPLLILSVGLITYFQNLTAAKTINNTATEVTIREDKVITNTPSIRLLFWIIKSERELQFDIRKFSRHQVSYPFKPIYGLDQKVWKLAAGETEVYIITDYFDIAFKEELENFLYWTDTPATV
jgi:hypothetical protein